MNQQQHLAQEIQQLAAQIPGNILRQLSRILFQANAANWRRLRNQILRAVPQPHLKERLAQFIDVWEKEAPNVSAEMVAFAVLTAVTSETHHRETQNVSLVWTGPDSQIIPLRRTDQTLIQLIREAKRSLHIVSFAVYKAESIKQALVEAAVRGVEISIFLETADASDGRIAYDTIQALGQNVSDRANIYIWPLAKRLRDDAGRHGSLHAKLAVADEQRMLLSSANLTGYAMTLNMEMGLLVRGGDIPAKVVAHLQHLIEQDTFQQINDTEILAKTTPSTSPSIIPPAWQEAIELAPECESLLKECLAQDTPLPIIGYELMNENGQVVAMAELAWEGEKTAVFLPDQKEDQSTFSKTGWETFQIDEAQGVLVELSNQSE